MSSTTDPRRSARGFTIVELLVTVVVMSILAVVAIPSASVNNERRLDMLQLQLQGVVLHAFDGKCAFSKDSLRVVAELKKLYKLNLDATDSHKLKES